LFGETVAVWRGAPMTTVTSIARTSRIAALMLMFGVSGVALLACTSNLAYQDPSTTHHRIDHPLLGFNCTDGREAALST
jgi:hypothetical protein